MSNKVDVEYLKDYFIEHWADADGPVESEAEQGNMFNGGVDKADVPLNAIEGFVEWGSMDSSQTLDEIRHADYEKMARVLYENEDNGLVERDELDGFDPLVKPLQKFVQKYEDKIVKKLRG